ncbi:hypothetical protein ALC53_10701 [Atta colombica]|uniref:Uncharacterized protein n=1 Tax=Atta colombica TaxID=520822 RepID=A0A151HZU7_9HYME|nr:hypothetical protein ALC53_10701 [Atta colombica]
MAIQPAQARRKRDSRGSDRGNNQVEEEGRGLKAALGSNDSSQNNPAYKLDCWWDMETECGQGREGRRGYVCNSETGNTKPPESGGKRKVEISGSLDLQSAGEKAFYRNLQSRRRVSTYVSMIVGMCEYVYMRVTRTRSRSAIMNSAHWSRAVRPSTMKRNPANGFLFMFAKVSAFGFRIKTILSTRDPVIFTSPQAPWKESAEGEGKMEGRLECKDSRGSGCVIALRTVH